MRVMTGLEESYETALRRIKDLDLGWDNLEDAIWIATKALHDSKALRPTPKGNL